MPRHNALLKKGNIMEKIKPRTELKRRLRLPKPVPLLDKGFDKDYTAEITADLRRRVLLGLPPAVGE